MYSEEIEGILSSAHIKPGDLVKLKTGEKIFEGVLMPRPDAGESGIMIIKLNNGYNIGIKFRESSKIEKLKSQQSSFSFPAAHAERRKGLNRVDLLYTGGTIGSKVDYVTGGVHMLTKPEELLYEVPELAGIADIHVDNLMSMASEDMSYLEWQAIAKAAAKAFNEGARGVVITHGTDTMHYTSAALSFMLKDIQGPVVLTGAQRSGDRGSSDAFMNLICSANIAANSDIGEVGICMHGSSSDDYCNFIRGTHARKMHTSRRDAFRPINNKVVARVEYGGKIEYLSEYRKMGSSEKKAKSMTDFEPRVAMVKVFPNSDPEILDYYLGKKYRGVIIEGTGLGHLPTSTPHWQYNWLRSLKRAVASGMILGVTSQCLSGRVNERVYRNLRLVRKAGGIFCEDMMPEVAYVKLGWLLGNYKKEEAGRLLGENMVGEISKRSEVDWFGE
jgi:glutamyl-tRNA(Gln) amidotransferase subunit D